MVRLREMPTSAATAAGHDLGASGVGGTGDMSFSGVHTWGSAVALAHLLSRAPSLVANKRVVELGGGTGLPSLVAAVTAQAVIMTDRSPACASSTLVACSHVSCRLLSRIVLLSYVYMPLLDSGSHSAFDRKSFAA